MLEGLDRFTGLGIVAAGVAVGYGLREASRPVRPFHWVVPVPRLPAALDGFTILHLTDLHGRAYPADVEAVLGAVDLQAPDAVAFTGDVLRRHDLEGGRGALDLLGMLARKLPVYLCPGNHDYAPDGSVAARPVLEAAGVSVLDNAHATGPRDTVFIGLGDPQTHRDDLDGALEEIPPGFPVLLAHSPVVFPRVALRGLPLVLAGHTHGGQARLPRIGSVWVPGQRGLFPEWDRGIFRREDSVMVVSSGVGVSGPPFRYLVPPEFLLLTLRPAGGSGETDDRRTNTWRKG